MSRAMVKLLVSVRNAHEAAIALSAGADWIDLKEPARGALAAVDIDIARETVSIVDGGCPVSAALGELADGDGASASRLLGVPRISVVKLGLAGCGTMPDWQGLWRARFSSAQIEGKNLAAVVYADWQAAEAPSPDAVLECAHQAAGKFLLIDTFHKTGQSTVDLWGIPALEDFVNRASRLGFVVVLAGSIQRFHLPQLAGLPLGAVAIRGAACRAGRKSSLDRDLVAEFRAELLRYDFAPPWHAP